MKEIQSIITLLLWFFFGIHLLSVIFCSFSSMQIFSSSLNNRIRTLRNLIPLKNLKFFNVVIQQAKSRQCLIVSCCCGLIFSLMMIAISTVIGWTSDGFTSYPGWMWLILNLIPTPFHFFFYFWYKKIYISEVSFTFRNINKDISFLKNAQFVNRKLYNLRLRRLVNRVIEKRLLNDEFRTKHQSGSMLQIFKIYNFFYLLLNQGAAKVLIDTGQNSTVTVEQMLKQVCDYLDSCNIEIKVARLARKGSSIVYLQEFLKEN